MMWNERDPSIRAVQSALSASSSAPWCLQGAAVGLWARERLGRYRAGRVRIDFYPDKRTIRVIDSLWTGAVGGDASSILNRIMAEWAGLGARTGFIQRRPPLPVLSGWHSAVAHDVKP